MSDLVSGPTNEMTELAIVHSMKDKSPMPIYSEEGETSTSADILSLHVQNEAEHEGEGVNASTVVEPLSLNLVMVMHIVPDKQDYNFVEKVQLP